NGWSTNSVRLRPLSTKNTYDAAQLNLEYDLNDSLTLKGGINYKDFKFETTAARRASENGAGVDLNGRMMAYNSGLGPIILGQYLTSMPSLRTIIFTATPVCSKLSSEKLKITQLMKNQLVPTSNWPSTPPSARLLFAVTWAYVK